MKNERWRMNKDQDEQGSMVFEGWTTDQWSMKKEWWRMKKDQWWMKNEWWRMNIDQWSMNNEW